MDEKQIRQLERAVTGYFDYIEDLIERENVFTMEEFSKSVNEFLEFRRYDILKDNGRISHKQAVEKAYQEYDIFNKTQPIESDFDKMVKGIDKGLKIPISLSKEKDKFMKSRVNYIDNLRTVTVSLLIIYHLAISYNSWGEANYIFFQSVNPIASIVVFISPWFMPLMFLLAGISASFSIVHFPIVVLCQCFISLTGVGCIYNFVLSLAISTIVTCSACYIIDKNTIISILFGLKK